MSIDDLRKNLRARAGKGPSRSKAQREPVTSIAKVERGRSRKNSRTKGNRGELDVAKMFSKWCGEVVRRTPGSGGWGGAKDFGTTADLICKRKAFPFHVEIKHREGWVLDDLITGVRKDHDKSIVQWWAQCLDSCPKRIDDDGDVFFTKTPMLVFRRNHQPWLVMTFATHTVSDQSEFEIITEKYSDCRVTVQLLRRFLGDTPVPKGLKNWVRS